MAEIAIDHTLPPKMPSPDSLGKDAMGTSHRKVTLDGNKLDVKTGHEDQVHVVDVFSDLLVAIVPSPEGDLSVGHAAILSGLCSGAASPHGLSGVVPIALHVDKVLRAENDFLEVCDVAQILRRLKSVAEAQSER